MKFVPLCYFFLCLFSPQFYGQAQTSAPINGLVLHYSFSGNSLDSSPQSNDGLPRGVTFTQDRFGHPNSALAFNGTSAYLEAERALPESNSITVSLWLMLNSWVQLNSWGNLQVIFFEGDDSPGRDVGCYITGGFHFSVKSDHILSYVNWLPPVGAWTHLVCVADAGGRKMSIWIDGQKVKEASFTQGANIGFHSAFNLGRRPGVYNDWFIAGAMDEVRVYNRALTPVEITTLYSLEGGVSKSLDIEVETLKLSLHLIPGKSYMLQSSPDLIIWTDSGAPFVAQLAEQQASVDAGENKKFWRVVEAP